METKLQVKDLRISFRTSNGKVQAVRGINFNLAKGETLAIVGESGSGKSVTSKAILGIQAGNAITESGEIIYDGKDLLKISEEEFHKIRGDKIAMIFQDPMSSLNPIVKIGKQLTEAMILKGKARQRESRASFNSYLKLLNKAMVDACAADDAARAEKINEMCKKFDKFEFKHIELEDAYKKSYEAAVETISDIEDLAFELDKNACKDAPYRLNDIISQSKATPNPYVVTEGKEEVLSLVSRLKEQLRSGKQKEDYSEVCASMRKIQKILKKAVSKPVPDFFRMGYYMTFSGKELPDMEIPELNAYLKDYIDREFLNDFGSDVQAALKFTSNVSYANMEKAIEVMKDKRQVFTQETLDKNACKEASSILWNAVSATIDPLALVKDSLSYTFASSLKSEIETYFFAITNNVKEEKIYEKNKRKHDALVAKGKNPDWEVAAAAVTDLQMVKNNITHLIDRLADHYQELLQARESRDYEEETGHVINYLKECASGVVDKVTRRVAKDRAIKLMDEVGIAEPHKRYNQYPFEFSGGMRQRIVIAIALAANPDILICDEPTTALDVTIQAQILELINKLKEERQLSVIFITHDLGVVANMADRVAVMYAGKIVEYGTAEDIFYEAAHPYTWALLSSMPDLDTNDRLEAIPGTPPNMIYPPVGDAFAPRNKYAMQIDFEKQPPMFKISDSHYAATWLQHPDAPKVPRPKVVEDRIARMRKKREVEDAE